MAGAKIVLSRASQDVTEACGSVSLCSVAQGVGTTPLATSRPQNPSAAICNRFKSVKESRAVQALARRSREPTFRSRWPPPRSGQQPERRTRYVDRRVASSFKSSTRRPHFFAVVFNGNGAKIEEATLALKGQLDVP